MNYEDFQHLARLFVVGALDEDELEEFHTGKRLFGSRAEEFIAECRKLNAVFALSLTPKPPLPETKAKLLARIRATPRYREKLASSDEAALPGPELACESRAQRLN